jgi:hypothetical protein
MITINGLSKGQVKLLDIMWSINDLEVYEEWKCALNLELQDMVDVLEQMVILATLDEDAETMQEYPEAQEVLSKFAL